ncbi:DUF2163 domain-containing protein [Novosphingobium mangrovi (ex Huang et al. 2023)]|uniref:DUF2163 domain-containing protein n=1 Tax=Novosphingobium mangrovi (ex Huang et al. 2023) TaxID=2976432 RepID=A0ABT2I1L1_9SPHN|nr:DUF2163 domain-containing protein [Novosphingobium mangrovi (ex Huang et al. 2023)]MCT2398533.1 DUF2163 domain-containing protein [Novosphingobium mangrovi (ex Huang et al. 2023)]
MAGDLVSRPGTPAVLTALSSGTPFAAECVIMAARDGTRAGFTTLDEPVYIDLSLGAGTDTCDADMVLSALTLSEGLDASFFEMQGPLGPVLTGPEVDGGKWNDADAWLVAVSPGIAGFVPLMSGKVREARSEDLRFVLEIRNQGDLLNQDLGKVLTPYCDADLGDARCGYALVPVAATVTAVTDAMRFSIGYSGTFADDHFNLGKIEFTGGVLDGVVAKNLFDFTSGGVGAGAVVLWEPLPALPQVGDPLEIAIGCAKTRSACRAFHGDTRPFRGFPDQPGTEQLLQYPDGTA